MLKQTTLYNIERAKFYSRVQQTGENIAEFAFQLKRLASNCNFADHMDIILRDWLIYNIRNDYNKEKTIKGDKQTFDDAVAEALLHETSAQSMSNTHQDVNKFNNGAQTYNTKIQCKSKVVHEQAKRQ